jgi:hypothetical protein
VRHRQASDRGSVTLGLAIVFPVVLALIVVILQAALVWHARDLAQAAAAEGLRIERSPSMSVDAGELRARTFLVETSRHLLGNVTISSSRVAGIATVTVTGTALGVLPGLGLRVHTTVSGPVEQFVSDTGGTS